MRITKLILSLMVSVAIALLCGVPATRANAETFTHEAGGIQFDLPNGWESEVDGEMLTVSSPDNTISVVFWVTEADEFDAASEALGEEIGKQVQNLDFDGEPKEGQHNGMEFATVKGTGKVGGQNVAFSADLVMAKKPVIILTFASPENFEKHQGSYAALIKSIRKVG